MKTIIDSDRGPVYTVACTAIAFGLCMGFVALPVMYAFGYIAGLLLLFLAQYLWLELAFICAIIVYYTGVFIACVFTTYVYVPACAIVDSALSSVNSWWSSNVAPRIPEIHIPTIRVSLS